MIPKVIHYCWFGGKPLPKLAEKCIASWKKYCPDYEIKEWNESNFDVNCTDFSKEAFEAKNWAFVSDVARLKVIYEEGGIYLDTDVELVRSLDDLLENRCFLGEETSGVIGTGLGYGAEKGNVIVGEMLQQYGGHYLLGKGIYDDVPSPKKNTAPLFKYGYRSCDNRIWECEHATVYPPEYFCPLTRESGVLEITQNTYSIHHFSALWIPDDVKQLEQDIEEMEKKNNRILAFFKRQNMRYVFYKNKGDVRSFPEYVLRKAKKKWLDHHR